MRSNFALKARLPGTEFLDAETGRQKSHGFDILAKFFSDKPRLDAFTSTLDRCAMGAAMEAINTFNQWWNDIRDHTYARKAVAAV